MHIRFTPFPMSSQFDSASAAFFKLIRGESSYNFKI